MPPKLTKKIAFAAAQDEANRSMRKGGRKAWNKDDYNICVCKYNELMALISPPEKVGKRLTL